MKLTPEQRIELHGFNNLTKSLSFNMYDVCYTKTREEREAYIDYIDEQYSAERLTKILKNVSDIIGAHVLNVAQQDYVPQGASVTVLVSEGPVVEVPDESYDESPGPLPDNVVMQLDKSHITVHTYPEYHPDEGISTFRADIDVSTCGEISPLKALNYLIHSFDTDIMTIDYRVRGFTRDTDGRKLFHTKCKIRDFDLDNYLFGYTKEKLDPEEAEEITERLTTEMDEIFYGKNISPGSIAE